MSKLLLVLIVILFFITFSREGFSNIKFRPSNVCLTVEQTWSKDVIADTIRPGIGGVYGEDSEFVSGDLGNWQMYILSKDGEEWEKYFRQGLPAFANNYTEVGLDEPKYEKANCRFNEKSWLLSDTVFYDFNDPTILANVHKLLLWYGCYNKVKIPDDGTNTLALPGRTGKKAYSINAWKDYAKNNGYRVIGFYIPDIKRGYAEWVFVNKNNIYSNVNASSCSKLKVQSWEFTSNSEIKNVYSNLCLTLDGSSLTQDKCKNLPSQKFDYTSENKIKNLSTGKYLQIDQNNNLILTSDISLSSSFTSPVSLKCTLLASDGCDKIAGKYFAFDSKSESEKDYQKLNEAKRRFGLCYQALQNGNRMICVKEDEKFFNSVEGLE